MSHPDEPTAAGFNLSLLMIQTVLKDTKYSVTTTFCGEVSSFLARKDIDDKKFT